MRGLEVDVGLDRELTCAGRRRRGYDEPVLRRALADRGGRPVPEAHFFSDKRHDLLRCFLRSNLRRLIREEPSRLAQLILSRAPLISAEKRVCQSIVFIVTVLPPQIGRKRGGAFLRPLAVEEQERLRRTRGDVPSRCARETFRLIEGLEQGVAPIAAYFLENR